ncbi:putative 37S ribosomal protein S26A, mitochondrial [Acrodontium crateriforme]|uniref:37S ribosomal protein S26A, mitochondrial n=1 Tax=Acrodontium crateriforme TaxID=150365 RepID=A0AAQ3R6V6_9PEZI|nr:putative 37S ribosomal protein S26A, mitochondrial [Acrodontium crateriforme]
MITRRLARPLAAWTCPSCTRASLLPQQRLRQRMQQVRALSEVPKLSAHEEFSQEGIPGFMGADGYRIAWEQYQRMVVDKMNALVAGESFENNTPKELVLRFARDPMAANIFNNASMAFNNHFFFKSLSTDPVPLDKFPTLKEDLIKSFGSIDALRTTMLDTADSMFGPGFVWLVYCNKLDGPGATSGGQYRILNTYNAGTPFPEAGYRQQKLDMNNQNEASFKAYQSSSPVNNTGAFGQFSASGKADSKLPPGGTSLIPILCVNTWEHVYMRDWGVTGKRKYLSDWWDCIDWSAVERELPREFKLKFQ